MNQLVTPIKYPSIGNEVNGQEWDSLEKAESSALSGNLESWYSVNQFAERAHVPSNTVYQWINRNKIEHDVNSDGIIVINPVSLIDVPRPVASRREVREVWTGTFSRTGRNILRAHALGGNESYTVEVGSRFVLALFGLLQKEQAMSELKLFCQRHPRLREVFRANVRLLADNIDNEI